MVGLRGQVRPYLEEIQMCDCVGKVEEELNKKNTTLTMATMVNMENGKCRQSLMMATERLRTDTYQNSRTKIVRVMPSFCPFCGARIETTSS